MHSIASKKWPNISYPCSSKFYLSSDLKSVFLYNKLYKKCFYFLFYCNDTGIGCWNNNLYCNLQWKEFILQDIQGCVNRGILLASLARKVGWLANMSMFIFKKNRPFYIKGYHLFSTIKYNKLCFSGLQLNIQWDKAAFSEMY